MSTLEKMIRSQVENRSMGETDLRICLLEKEIEALRSVISEREEDPAIYSQWHKAQAIRELLNHLPRI